MSPQTLCNSRPGQQHHDRCEIGEAVTELVGYRRRRCFKRVLGVGNIPYGVPVRVHSAAPFARRLVGGLCGPSKGLWSVIHAMMEASRPQESALQRPFCSRRGARRGSALQVLEFVLDVLPLIGIRRGVDLFRDDRPVFGQVRVELYELFLILGDIVFG